MPVIIPINQLTQTGEVIDYVLLTAEQYIKGYAFGGIITPLDSPLFPADIKAAYIANQIGVYTNFGGVTVTENSVILYDGVDTYSIASIGGTGVTSGIVSINGYTGPIVMLNTDDIPEGNVNKYVHGVYPTDISHLTDTTGILDTFALKVNVLELDNGIEYTPQYNYNPATKKYVDDAITSSLLTATVAIANIANNVNWDLADPPPIDATIVAHMADLTIHFTKESIDAYTTAEADQIHTDLDGRITVVEEWIASPGSQSGVTQALFFSHIYNLSVHFTMEDMYDYIVENYQVGVFAVECSGQEVV